MSHDEMVLIGTLGKPHGLRGELTVHCRTDEPERRFADGAVVVLGSREAVVRSTRWHQGVLLLSLDGVADRTTAETLRGTQVWAPVPADEVPVEAGEYYDRQLVGLAVRDAAGRDAGRVVSILHLPAQDVLVVDVAGEERLVPFVAQLVPVVDVPGGWLQVSDLGGLLYDVEDEQ